MSLDIISIEIRKELVYQRLKTNGHLSGCLGIIDILVALFFHKMHLNTENPLDEERDRFILSGYHYPALYCVLSKKGFFNKKLLTEMDSFNTRLKPNIETPGFEVSSYSSLGQGVSIANGISLGLKLKKNTTSKVFVLIGDGEMNEGQIWEAFLTTIHHNICNLTIIVNKNRLQLDGNTESIKHFPIEKTLISLGFNVLSVDGHNINSIINSLNSIENNNKPSVLICHTLKGRGISFIEDDPIKYHACQLNEFDFKRAIEELCL